MSCILKSCSPPCSIGINILQDLRRNEYSRFVFRNVKDPFGILFDCNVETCIPQLFGGGGRKSSPFFKLLRLAAKPESGM